MGHYFVMPGPRVIADEHGHYGRRVPRGHFAICENGKNRNVAIAAVAVFTRSFERAKGICKYLNQQQEEK